MKATPAVLIAVCGGCAGHARQTAEDFQPPPAERTALGRWLETGEHREWESWSRVGATLGSGGARVFLSPPLFESLLSRGLQHPEGGVAVRELYAEDFKTLTGYSVLIKVAAPVEADSWFCFERLSLEPEAEVDVAERGAPGCAQCHGQGSDFIRSTLPLP